MIFVSISFDFIYWCVCVIYVPVSVHVCTPVFMCDEGQRSSSIVPHLTGFAIYSHVYVCICMWVQVRGQLLTTRSLLLLHESQELN